MIKAPANSNSKSMLWSVVTGMVVWFAVAYILIFVVLDTPRHEETANLLDSATESVDMSLDQPGSGETAIVEPQDAVARSDVQSAKPMDLSTSWMDNTALASGWYVQVGSYKSTVEAEVERLKYSRLQVPVHTEVSGDELTHLFIGPYLNENDAVRMKEQIVDQLGVKQIEIRQIEVSQMAETDVVDEQRSDSQPTPAFEVVSEEPSTPQDQPSEVQPTPPTPAVEPVPDSQSEPEVELATEVEPAPTSEPITEVQPEPEIQVAEPSPPTPEPVQVVSEPQPTPEIEPVSESPAVVESSVATGNWYLQVGAFKKIENARKLGNKIRDLNLPLKIERTGNEFIRVLVGPYPTRNAANQLRSEVVNKLSIENVIVRQVEE